MLQEISFKGKNAAKITAFGKSTELCKIFGSEETICLLNFLSEQPRQYKDIEANINLPKTTLVRRLNSLYLYKIIEKEPFIARGRKTHLYCLTQVGSDMMKVIHLYERTVSLPSSQKKIIEIEKHKD